MIRTESKRVHGGQSGVILSTQEGKIAARIEAIQKLLSSAVLQPELAKKLTREKKRLEKLLLAGAGATNGVLAPKLVEQLEQRVKKIDGQLRAGLVTEKLARELETEKARLQKFIVSATAGFTGPQGLEEIAGRIAEIDRLLVAGLLEKPLSDALAKEKQRLEKILLAGAMAPDMMKAINERLREINRALFAGTLTLDLADQLTSEKKMLETLLTVV